MSGNSSGYGGLPAFADYMRAENTDLSMDLLRPDTTPLGWSIQRYLLQKAISVFEWQMPKNWARNYVLYVLYCWGRVAVVNTDLFGVIAQACGLMGYNVYYQPTTAIISNALLAGNLTPTINQDCVILRLQPDYGGIMDLVTMYAGLMAQAVEAVGINLNNSKVAYALFAADKSTAEAYRKAVDQINNGQPAVILDKKLQREDGSPAWEMFTRDVRQNYIVPDLLADLRKLETMYDTEIGIPNANTDKRERLITSEVNANNIETYSKCALWLEELQDGCQRAREMFNINLSVDWRRSPVPPTVDSGREEAAVDE